MKNQMIMKIIKKKQTCFILKWTIRKINSHFYQNNLSLKKIQKKQMNTIRQMNVNLFNKIHKKIMNSKMKTNEIMMIKMIRMIHQINKSIGQMNILNNQLRKYQTKQSPRTKLNLLERLTIIIQKIKDFLKHKILFKNLKILVTKNQYINHLFKKL